MRRWAIGIVVSEHTDDGVRALNVNDLTDNRPYDAVRSNPPVEPASPNRLPCAVRDVNAAARGDTGGPAPISGQSLLGSSLKRIIRRARTANLLTALPADRTTGGRVGAGG